MLDLYYDDAAAYAGLTYECLRSYIARGEEDLAEGRATLYSTFVSEFRKREAQGRAHRVGNIIAAGRKEQHWQANAWLLERRHPQKYGRRQLDVHTTGQQTVDVVVHQVPVPVEPPVLEGVLVRGSEAPTGGREGENGTNGGGRVLLPPSSGEGSDSGGNGG